MTTFLICVLAIVVIVLLFLLYRLVEKSFWLYNEDKIRQHVAWCVKDVNRLIGCLRYVQRLSKEKTPNCDVPRADKLITIEDGFWLTEDDEITIAKEILYEYQKKLAQTFFENKLSTFKSFRNLTEEEYFLVTLGEFLDKNQCSSEIFSGKMYETKEYTPLGMWGVPLFAATYKLKDFAVVYHKILLITETYYLALQKNPYDTGTVYYQSINHTKEVLDKREIKVSRL